jgi:hypothetical protein
MYGETLPFDRHWLNGSLRFEDLGLPLLSLALFFKKVHKMIFMRRFPLWCRSFKMLNAKTVGR